MQKWSFNDFAQNELYTYMHVSLNNKSETPMSMCYFDHFTSHRKCFTQIEISPAVGKVPQIIHILSAQGRSSEVFLTG